MSYISSTFAALVGLFRHVIPLVEVADSTVPTARNLQGNSAGVAKIDATVRDQSGIYTPTHALIPDGPCDVIWVDTENATITGITAGGQSITTPALRTKDWIGMSFRVISSVSVGNVYLGWYMKG